jgi:ATP-binding cassette subfamily B protein
MKQIREILKKNIKSVIIYVMTGLLIAFLTNYKIKIFQKVIDDFSNHTISIKIIIFYGSTLIFYYLISYFDEYPSKYLENAIYLEFKLSALKKISKMQYNEYQNLGIGKLTQKIENGSEAGKSIIFDFWLHIIRELIPTILFSIFFIWKMNHLISYFILAGYLFVFLISRFLLKFLYKIKNRILNNEEIMNHYLIRSITEMVVFRTNNLFKNEILKAKKSKNEIIKLKVKMNMIHEAFFVIFAIFVALLNVGILIYAWNNKNISIGTTVALISLIENAYIPIAIFNVLFVKYKLEQATFKRYEEFLNLKNDVKLESGKKVKIKYGEIKIKNLNFKYNKKPIIKNLNLHIKKGEKIAFVGSSGCGKSTLVKILSGLLKYNLGSIEVDNYNLNSLCLNDFYNHITYISQETPIFNGTMRENIAYALNVEDKKIMEIITKVRLDEILKFMDKELETTIGEKGITLSGGERQKLALSRLWLKKSKIVILDEPTSSMDNITENIIMKEIMNQISNATLIVIAHRLNTIKNFDRIVVFKNGEIVEQGNFQKLYNNKLYFRELWEKNKT